MNHNETYYCYITNYLISDCFAGLSSFDLLYLVVAIMIFGLPSISEDYKNSLYLDILPVSYGFGHIGRVGSVFVTM